MSEHSPEPWRLVGADTDSDFGTTQIVDASGRRIVWPGAVGTINAHRIVACVNACRGIPTAQLECFGVATLGGPLPQSSIDAFANVLRAHGYAVTEPAEHEDLDTPERTTGDD